MLVSRRQFAVSLLASFALFVGIARFSAPCAADSAAQTGQSLTVRVNGVRNDNGNIIVALFHGGDGFPDKDEKALTTRVVSIAKEATTVNITFKDLTAGNYAVSLFHDENANGKLDEHWGIPTEGFGVSNNPRLHWGAPTYKEARFSIPANAPETTIDISLRYLRRSGKR